MEKHIRAATVVATLLDTKFKLFNFRFGVSAIINLIPGTGDLVDVVLSLYIVWIGTRIGLPGIKIAKMLWNILFSFLIGLVPVFGDAVYLFYKPNLRNLRILKQAIKT